MLHRIDLRGPNPRNVRFPPKADITAANRSAISGAVAQLVDDRDAIDQSDERVMTGRSIGHLRGVYVDIVGPADAAAKCVVPI